MLIYFVSLLFTCLISFSSLSSKENLEEKQQITELASTLEAFETVQAERIWPHFKLNGCPSVVHLQNGHIYSFYLSPSSLWKKEKIRQRTVLFSDKDHWGVTKIMMHPSFAIEGKKAFVIRFDTEARSDQFNLSLLTFVHERFHLYQFDSFKRKEGPPPHYVDEWKEQNQVLMELEHVLLKKFLQYSNQPHLQREFLKDFIAVNAVRLKSLSLTSVAWEDLQQRMEGLADYVSVKTFEVFPLIENFSVEQAILEMRKKKTGKVYSLVNDAIKGRHYFVGAVLGFALDFIQSDWKSEVEKGEPLRVLLAHGLGMSQQDVDERFARIKSSTEFEGIQQYIQAKLNQEKGEINQLFQAYRDTQGIPVYIARPLKQPISGGGHNHKSFHIGNGHTLSLHDTSFSSSRNQQWRLRFKSVPYMFEDPVGGRVFKLQEDALIRIDDHQILASDLKAQSASYNFSSLTWEDKHCDFIADISGEIHSSKGKIYIKLNQE